MALHNLQLDHVNDIDVHFRCTQCDQVIGFNKPGIGEPCAIDNGDGTWAAPENADIWMSPCVE